MSIAVNIKEAMVNVKGVDVNIVEVEVNTVEVEVNIVEVEVNIVEIVEVNIVPMVMKAGEGNPPKLYIMFVIQTRVVTVCVLTTPDRKDLLCNT
jgi:hypothetical protein